MEASQSWWSWWLVGWNKRCGSSILSEKMFQKWYRTNSNNYIHSYSTSTTPLPSPLQLFPLENVAEQYNTNVSYLMEHQVQPKWLSDVSTVITFCGSFLFDRAVVLLGSRSMSCTNLAQCWHLWRSDFHDGCAHFSELCGFHYTVFYQDWAFPWCFHSQCRVGLDSTMYALVTMVAFLSLRYILLSNTQKCCTTIPNAH